MMLRPVEVPLEAGTTIRGWHTPRGLYADAARAALRL